MKDFLSKNTHLKFVYLDFSSEANKIEPECNLDFFNPKYLSSKSTWIFKCRSENYVVIKTDSISVDEKTVLSKFYKTIEMS